MKSSLSHLDRWRQQRGPYASAPGVTYGRFTLFTGSEGRDRLLVVACDGAETGWDHVSVSAWVYGKTKSSPVKPRLPTWDEMCRVKDLFFDAEECVIQFHPPASQYVNNAKNCLHLWRNTQAEQPLPPSILVGTLAPQSRTPA